MSCLGFKDVYGFMLRTSAVFFIQTKKYKYQDTVPQGYLLAEDGPSGRRLRVVCLFDTKKYQYYAVGFPIMGLVSLDSHVLCWGPRWKANLES